MSVVKHGHKADFPLRKGAACGRAQGGTCASLSMCLERNLSRPNTYNKKSKKHQFFVLLEEKTGKAKPAIKDEGQLGLS